MSVTIEPSPFVVSETTSGAPTELTITSAPATPLATAAEDTATA